MSARTHPAGALAAWACASLLVGTAWAGPGAHGPNGEHLDAPATAASPDRLSRLPDGSVFLPMAAQSRLQIRTASVQASAASASLELPARVVVDPNASGQVQALSAGRLQPGPRGLPVAGQAVQRGEVLAHVDHNPTPLETAALQAQLAELRSSRAIAAQRLQRLESLEGTVARKDLEVARAELQGLDARAAAMQAGVGTREALVAPLSGVVAASNARAGQVVEPRDLVFEVVDPRRVLVEATTADPTLGARLGPAALAGLPQVRLEFLGAARTLRDGLLPLSFRATTPGDAAVPLAIGQPVTLVAQLRETAQGHVLPADALTRSPSNEPIVWVKVGAERFAPQPVQARALDARTVLVTRGLADAQRVVVQGAALLTQIR